MTKKEKSMEEELNEDKQREAEEVQAKEEAKQAKKNQKRWYIVHTYSGHENKVKVNLEKRIEYMNMGEKIFRIEVPQKTVTQMKGGKKQEREEKESRRAAKRAQLIERLKNPNYVSTNIEGKKDIDFTNMLREHFGVSR